MTITVRKLHLAIAVLAVALIAPATAVATHIFSDVDDDRFYADPIEWALDNDITTGSPAGSNTFKPDDPVTRGESVTFLKRYDDNIVQPALAVLTGEASRFVPGSAFLPTHVFGGDSTGVDEFYADGRCVFDEGNGVGNLLFHAPLELPDGSVITALTFYGRDSTALADITIRLRRVQFDMTPGASLVRSDTVLAAFTTSALSGEGAVPHDLVPDETTGKVGMVRRFYTLEAEIDRSTTSPGLDNQICGVQVDYQLPTA